jgi:SAM-dependent methyltransferase
MRHMASVWERKAEEYARHAEGSAYNALYERPAMLELIGPVAGLEVLDAGCGPGLYAEELVRRGARVTAIDGSPAMVELARARLGERATLHVHDLTQPLGWAPDVSFDLVVMALVIHHVDDRVALLRELHRVLKPGGRLVMSTHHAMADWLRLGGSYFDVEPVEEVWRDDWEVRFWRLPLTETCAEIATAGFLIERIVEPRPSEELARSFPEVHAKLAERPSFILFRLLRPGPTPAA